MPKNDGYRLVAVLSAAKESLKWDYAFGIQMYLSETLHVVLSLLPLGYLILQSAKTGKISVWV